MEITIIRPAHSTPAKRCESWRQVKLEAERMREYVRGGEYGEGIYKGMYAVSHAQVSFKPLHFFVLNEGLENGQLPKWFGHWCIMNLEIVEKGMPVRWGEACLSFPWRQPRRTDRFARVTVTYYIPFLWTWRKVRRKFKDLPAFLIQHEDEHARGENMFGYVSRTYNHSEESINVALLMQRLVTGHGELIR